MKNIFGKERGGRGWVLAWVFMAQLGVGGFLSHAASRNFYDDRLVAQAREKVEHHGWAQRQQRAMETRVGWILEMSDQELWDFVPPVTQRRALNVAFNVGCPIHGTEVFRKGGPYPWIISRERPFKVECPVGGEIYPTNNFVAWHHGGREGEIDTTEEYMDDGTGYIGPDGQGYHFVAHYIFWQRWRREIVPALGDLRDLYLLTDHKRYARAAAILLARIATDYPESDYAIQAVHREEPPHEIRGGILDYIWENGAIITPGATAFDAINPSLDDPEVVGFLWTKGIRDVRRHVEKNLLYELVNRITGGRKGEHENRIWGNFGMYQRSMATLAVVLNNEDPQRGLTSMEMVEWIMRPGPWNEVGAIREALWNRFYRDGHGGEASPAYSAGWANGVSSVAQILSKLDQNLYEHPKMRRLVDVWLDMAVFGKWAPSIGDTGDIFGSQRLGWYRNILLPAYEATGEQRWAKALEMIGVADNQLWESVPLDEIRKDAAEFGEWPTGGTRLLGGYGLAIAESFTAPVGLALYYGYAGGGHGHRDRLNIEMFALDRPVLPQHGYPTPLGSMEEAPKRFLWTSNTIAHYGVTVNRKWQQTHDRGNLNLLASTPAMQVVDASAEEVAYPGEASVYRRTSLLIENPAGQPYLFDVFRVAGGWEHVWSFHGPPFEGFETFGLELGPLQEEGTLAGLEVDFGELPTDEKTDGTSGFQYLFNVRRAAPPGAPWGATWSEPAENAHVRMTALPTAVTEVVLADCEPQLKPNHPKTMPYLLAFNGSGDPEDRAHTRSDFVAVVEPYEREPSLGQMRRFPTEGAGDAVAAFIGRSNGGDLMVSHVSPQDRSKVSLPEEMGESMTFEGELAHLAFDEGAMSSGTLVNARHFSSTWLEVKMEGEMRGQIESVDYIGNSIILDRRLEGAEALVGQTVVVGNDLHRTAFQVEAVGEVGGATAFFFGDMPMLIALGQVGEVKQAVLTTPTEFDQWQTDGGKHAGRRVVDSSRKNAFLIRAIDGQTFHLEGGAEAVARSFSVEPDSEENEFWVAEAGPGDEWQIPSLFWLKKTDEANSDPGSYDLVVNAAARVSIRHSGSIPKEWMFLDAAGEWRDLPVSIRSTFVEFEISPGMLADGRTTIQPKVR